MAKKLAPGRAVKPKRKCCKSRPRCKRCGVTLDRLSKQGLAERREDGRYVIVELIPKRALKEARRR
jgi:transposase-like protein